jgi:branched-chain amino acid transport system substrate-binding protein
MHGASRLQAMSALDGARLQLAESRGRIGSYKIRLRVLDDSTRQSAGWDPNQTTLDARIAGQDPTTIGYLGDFNSGASAISIPLLNRLGIPQVSPGSSAVGLTSGGPGAAPGEPQKYYPARVRTFARVVPTDAHQAIALVRAERAVGCQSTLVLDDGEVDGEDAALTFVLTAQSAGLKVVGVQAFQRQASAYTGLAQFVAGSKADCVLVSAIDEASSVRLTKQVASALPSATIFATAGLGDAAFVDPRLGGLPSSLDGRVILVSPMLPVAAYPRSARAFVADYDRHFGAPEPAAIFGYQAMAVLLGAIDRATDHGHRPAERLTVRNQLFSGRQVRGPLGDFSIDHAGDTSITRYGTYTINSGRLTPWSGTSGGLNSGFRFG